MIDDISTAFKWNQKDALFAEQILAYEATPEAIKYFSAHSSELSDYGYWFFLSTLWVSYTEYSDLKIWKTLFASQRPNKAIGIMKPSELKTFDNLPNKLTLYRAHWLNESDWIAYTLDLRIAKERGVNQISVYRVKKNHALALFLRRSEQEIIVLDKSLVKLKKIIPLSEVST
ncbi:hypothetical protein [Lactiplantibacillus plantarum]|uniref:hypothetical protein n=1 Tax=Lactiplantibacillus plantarum TaxID=1590 RepID=UPI0007C33CBC|nr:hypothetical protein [Lactiplantibacillus plantarum]KZU07877.1 prophage Lp1 protein 22 [Lactiplantibacillus plantarum]QRG93747.1 hypothetical protein JNO58_10515 [Lactiplantibacillus plantarum]QRG93791.1 hypothetical protein JNO58_10795 [Lactiplantibacillus plantarum]WNJ66523.1 hypothetical protein QTM04_10640 [Lactiplantibacillus plantarum]BEI64695.1 prophage protein [Lactiplantibacillus plantarum]